MRARARISALLLGLVLATFLAATALLTVPGAMASGWLDSVDEDAPVDTPSANRRFHLTMGALLAMAATGTSLLLMPAPRRARRQGSGAVTDRRVLDLVRDTATAFETHAPDEVCVSFGSGVVLEDELDRVYRRVRRRLVLPASLLLPAAEPSLLARLSAAQAALATTTRASAAWQSRADFLLRAAARAPEKNDGLKEEVAEAWYAAVAFDWAGRLLVRPGARLLRHRLRMAFERHEAAVEQVARTFVRDGATMHAAQELAFATYLNDTVRVSLSAGLLPADVVDGFSSRADDGTVAAETPARAEPDDVASAMLGELPFRKRVRTRVLPWKAIEDGALEASLREAGDDFARRLIVGDPRPTRVITAFFALLDELAAGRPIELAAKLDDELGDVRGFGVGARANAVLSQATVSLLATAMLLRGGQLVRLREARGLLVSFEGERVDVVRLVTEALASSGGARALAAWREKLSRRSEPRSYRPETEDLAGPPQGLRGREPRPASWELLRENGRARTRTAAWMLVALAPASVFSIAIMQLTWWGTLVACDVVLPQAIVALASVPSVLAPLALARPRRRPSTPTPRVEGDLGLLLDAQIQRYSARHATLAPDEIVVLDAVPGGAHAVIEDRAVQIAFGGVRILGVRRDVLEERNEDILAAALDRAFASVAGTTRWDMALRRRAAALGAVVGDRPLPELRGEQLDQGQGIFRSIALGVAALPRRAFRARLERLDLARAEATERYLDDVERAVAEARANAPMLTFPSCPASAGASSARSS